VFANDDAADWAGDLVDRGSVQDVRDALSGAAGLPPDGYLEAPDGSVALAAAELVAAAAGRPPPADAYSEHAILWAGQHPEIADAEWATLARQAIDRVMGDESELRALWLDDEDADPDAVQEWLRAIEDLRSRLGS
jgi:hypothetical protein